MEAGVLIRPGFWEEDSPVLMGDDSPVPHGIPGLVYFRTSGSTGRPKWIGLGRSALQTSATAVNRHLQVDAGSCWVLTLPLDHVGGFGVVARTWQAGCRMARFEGKWNAAAFTEWLGKEGGTHVSLVPTQVHDLVAEGLRAPESLRAVVVGGGLLSEATGRAARALGWPVLASYGMTEACSQIATQSLEVLDSPYVTAPISLLPCWDARKGDGGRIEIRGDALFSGILKCEDDGWKYEERSGEWFTTSDTGSVEDREIRISGRADALVKILGELVDPIAVEAEILALAGGAIAPGQAVVVAVEEARAGNKLVLVRERSADESSLDRAVESYHALCPGFRRISSVVVIDEIPRSPLGKPLRRELSGIVAGRVN
jgi:O-succinylbenzoic acid--CoA ligase